MKLTDNQFWFGIKKFIKGMYESCKNNYPILMFSTSIILTFVFLPFFLNLEGEIPINIERLFIFIGFISTISAILISKEEEIKKYPERLLISSIILFFLGIFINLFSTPLKLNAYSWFVSGFDISLKICSLLFMIIIAFIIYNLGSIANHYFKKQLK